MVESEGRQGGSAGRCQGQGRGVIYSSRSLPGTHKVLDHFPTIQPNEWLANGREDNEWERLGADAGVWRGRYLYQPPPQQQEDSRMPSRTDCTPIQPHLSCGHSPGSGVTLALQASWLAAAHTCSSCLRLSQVPGGCPELRHLWPLQEDPHFSGHGE